MHRLRAFYRSKGLVSRFIRLENGTTIRCWVHLRDASQKRKWGGKKGGGGGGEGRAPDAFVKPLSERKALLFLHGFGEDGTIAWEHQVAAFTKDYRVYIPDLVYFGASSTTNQQRTEVFQADCMHDLLVKLNIKVCFISAPSRLAEFSKFLEVIPSLSPLLQMWFAEFGRFLEGDSVSLTG